MFYQSLLLPSESPLLPIVLYRCLPDLYRSLPFSTAGIMAGGCHVTLDQLFLLQKFPKTFIMKLQDLASIGYQYEGLTPPELGDRSI